jgi:membrane-associated phospholipid phosphatase
MQTQSRFGAMGARSLVLTLALTIPAAAAGQPAPQLDSPSQATTVTDTRATAAPIRNWTPTFPQLFSGLGNDFRQLTANNGFLIIGIGGGAAFGAHTFDRSIAASGFGGSTMRDVFGPGQIVGGVLVQSGAAFATYFTGRMTGSPRLARVGAELVRAQIVAQGVTQTIKFGAPRTRPDGTAFSFPSGHTASSFATATVLQREFGWKAGIPAYVGAAWVGASRIQAERHYLSDVIAGATVGILAGRSVTVGLGDNRCSLAPTMVPGGIGFSVGRVKK